uniref:MICOS complex subunit MIC10 n=1 Tax=Nyssomyia neivai TaxID=330878 RepID=A0A1L8DBW9_9DIPT
MCAAKAEIKPFGEDEYGRKIDRCLTDVLVKSAGGLALGAVFSLLFFKRRRWPLVMGTGFGTGLAYSRCEKDLNS